MSEVERNNNDGVADLQDTANRVSSNRQDSYLDRSGMDANELDRDD